MTSKNRFGNFLVFWGLLALFIFFASLYTPDKQYNYWAFFIGLLLLWIGIPMRRAKPPAPPPPPKPAAPPPQPAPAKQAAPKKPGLLTTILKGPPPKKTAPSPPPQPAAPPRKKGLAALFSRKPKKK